MYDLRRVALTGAIAIALLLGCQKAPQSAEPKSHEEGTGDVAAVVNGTSIPATLVDVYVALQQSVRPGTRIDRKAATQRLVDLDLMAQDALKKGLDKDPLVQNQMEFQRLNILASAALRHQISSKTFTEDELKSEYQRLVAEAPKKEYRARHILTKTQQEAKAVVAELDKGADFAKLAKEKSLDASNKEGGELGWFSPAQMAEPFAKAVESLSKGSYTKTPVQTNFGWHVIQLEETRDVKLPPFEAVRNKVEQELQGQLANEYLSKLKEHAKITFE
jgi:peptidyl-prolyl cis-trans isomerase C